VYIFMGLLLAGYAVLGLLDKNRRIGNSIFWALLAGSFLFGSHLSDVQNGILALALILTGGFGLVRKPASETSTQPERRAKADRPGDWLFVPALIIPVTALLGTLFLKTTTLGGAPLLDAKQVTLISLALGVIIALVVAMLWLRPPPLTPLQE